MPTDPITVARATFAAYVNKDRAAIEALIAEDFRFTSPLDNAIDRATYFAICWPNSAQMASFAFVHLVAHDEHVFVTYEGATTDGKKFRNTEVLTVRDGQVHRVEVYFGWSIPHRVAAGEHANP
jgi:ketosteroid isomerase-like protein